MDLAVLVVQAAAVAVLDAVVVGAVRDVDFSVVLAAHRDLRLHPVRGDLLHRPLARHQRFDDRLLHLRAVGLEGHGQGAVRGEQAFAAARHRAQECEGDQGCA